MAPADKLEIEEIIARYNWAVDTCDWEALAEIYLPDAVFINLFGRAEGREAIIAAQEAQWAARPSSSEEWTGWRGAQHWTNNLVIEGDGDEAVARSYLLLVQPGGTGIQPTGGAHVVFMAQYTDHVKKVDGKWLFAERRVTAWPTEDLTNKIRKSESTAS